MTNQTIEQAVEERAGGVAEETKTAFKGLFCYWIDGAAFGLGFATMVKLTYLLWTM